MEKDKEEIIQLLDALKARDNAFITSLKFLIIGYIKNTRDIKAIDNIN